MAWTLWPVLMDMVIIICVYDFCYLYYDLGKQKIHRYIYHVHVPICFLMFMLCNDVYSIYGWMRMMVNKNDNGWKIVINYLLSQLFLIQYHLWSFMEPSSCTYIRMYTHTQFQPARCERRWSSHASSGYRAGLQQNQIIEELGASEFQPKWLWSHFAATPRHKDPAVVANRGTAPVPSMVP